MHHPLVRIALTISFMLGTGLALPASAADGKIVVSDPYIRLAPPRAPAIAAYMVIKNPGLTDRRLVKAASPIAKSVELHEHRNENNVMRMREVRSIVIKAGEQTELRPGGYHLMLIGVDKPLKEGENVVITLRFDDGSIKEIAARVRKLETTMANEPAVARGAMKH